MNVNKWIYRTSFPIGGAMLAKFLSRKHPKILMYHRISEDGLPGTIDVTQFRAQMEIIKRQFKPIALDELVSNYKKGMLTKNAIAITFDDGYEDFQKYAFPILKEYNLPSTIFITTGFVNGDLWLWPDQIKYALSNTNIKKVYLSGISEEIDLWHGVDKCWNRISDHCMTIPDKEKKKTIKELYQKLDVNFPKTAPKEYSPLSWDNIKLMMSHGVQIGCHSHSHPILTRLNDNELVYELKLSKELIKEKLGAQVEMFCYPNGQKKDFDNNVKNKILESGYRYSFTAYPSTAPLRNFLEIGRYNASPDYNDYLKTIYGYKYLSMLVS